MRSTCVCLFSSLMLLGLSPSCVAAPGSPLPVADASVKPADDGGLDAASLDRSVEPSQDFYLFANGGWMKQNPIPSDKPRWGRFNILAENNQDILHQILKDCSARKGASPSSIEQKLGDFYRLGMDEERLKTQGIQPLKADLERIRAAKDKAALTAIIISLHRRGIHPFFNFSATQDAKNSAIVIGELSQGGLGMPDRDYYFRTDEKSVKLRSAYQDHLNQAFLRLGYSAEIASQKANQVFELEKSLAQASMTKVEMRDPLATYNPTNVKALDAASSAWSWSRYMKDVGLTGGPDSRINLATPKFFEGFYAAIDKSEPAAVSSYLEWSLLRASYDYLSEDWAKFRFEFYGRALTGTPAQSLRWRRVVGTVDHLMGEALGQKYVEKAFPPAAKTRVQEMVNLITESLNEDLGTLSWMSPPTQKEARAKLAAFRSKIGYPDRWRDYGGLTIQGDSYLENVWRAQAFENARDMAKIGKPPDPNEWYMSPPTVNAYYDPQMNEIVFPAGIMQPPFFSLDADDAFNFGGIGAVIGHEITHGFDDQGRQYDGRGNLRNWWSPSDLESFNKLARLVEEQFSAYTVSDGLHVNGKLVLGESIADLGGLRLSYMAYQKWLKKKPSGTIGGFTPDQRYFLGYARIWAINLRPEYERLQVNTDPHPPAHFRVNGPLSNMPEFARAFRCPAGSPMVRSQPTVLW